LHQPPKVALFIQPLAAQSLVRNSVALPFKSSTDLESFKLSTAIAEAIQQVKFKHKLELSRCPKEHRAKKVTAAVRRWG